MTDNTWEKHSSHSLDANDINGCHGFHSLVNNSLLALRQNEQSLFNDCLYLSRCSRVSISYHYLHVLMCSIHVHVYNLLCVDCMV